MNKDKLYKTILDKIKADLKIAVDAVRMAYESATDSENIAECKYDTKGLEASYLVQGQARRVEELETSLAAFQSMKPRPVDKVMLNALLTLEDENGTREFMYISPSAGGLKINFEGEEIIIMTPASPLGRALLAKTAGEQVDVTIGRREKTYKILNIQ